MKKLIKKILREEIDDFDWIRDNSISGEELRDLILQTGATSIPFDRVGGDLNLYDTQIKSLGNLQSVGGYLDLGETPIESLGNLQSVEGYLYLEGTPIESLGNLESVGGYLNLEYAQIEDLGNLGSVGGYLDLTGTPFAEKHSKAEIRQMVQVGGGIYM
jgi:hypothetical protein